MLSIRFSPRPVTVLTGCVVCLHLANYGSVAPAAEPGDPVVSALHLSVGRRIGDARKWLEERDFKSLTQTAGGLRVLAGLLQARSDDKSWQAATDQVLAAIGGLSEAARGEDAARCTAALDKLQMAASAVKAVEPTGKPQSPRQASGGLRPLMLLMDSIRGDAKIDLLTGNVEGAKKGAYVLSEVGRVVSNSGSGSAQDRQRWPELSTAFVEASLVAARSPTTDADTMRQLLRSVSQRCEACHETR